MLRPDRLQGANWGVGLARPPSMGSGRAIAVQGVPLILMLHTRLLGEFRVSYGDRLLEAFLLATPADAPQSRQHLALLFWPDSTESQARTNLRKPLFDLRQALPDAHTYLHSDTQTVHWLAAAPLSLDVADLEGALKNAAAAEDRDDKQRSSGGGHVPANRVPHCGRQRSVGHVVRLAGTKRVAPRPVVVTPGWPCGCLGTAARVAHHDAPPSQGRIDRPAKAGTMGPEEDAMTPNADTGEHPWIPIRVRIPIRAFIALAAIVVAYLALGLLYATLTPPWQVPDEPAHYNYVRYLVEERRLPVLQQGDYDQTYLSEIVDQKFDPTYSIDSIRYEYHQPPLYYLLLAPVYALSGGALLPLRLTSVLLGAGVVIVAYLAVHKAYPERVGLALSTAAFVAFIPQHIAMNAGVQNDPLAELILGLVLLRLVSWLRSDIAWTTRQHAVTGVIVGLGLLTKLSTYIAVPLVLIAVVLKHSDRSPRQGRSGEGERGFEGRGLDVQAALPALAALLLPALLLSLPWFVRNIVVYDNLDVTGLGRHAEVVRGQLTTAQWIERYGWRQLPGAFIRTTFRSFWGQFGWMAVPMEWRAYLALRVFSILAAVGLVFRVVDAFEICITSRVVAKGLWPELRSGCHSRERSIMRKMCCNAPFVLH